MNNYMYIILCSDNSLYTGWTNDLAKRMKAHNSGQGAKYTKSRRPVRLCYWEMFDTKQEAMSREAQVKRLTRSMKMELIKSNNEFSKGSVKGAVKNKTEGVTKYIGKDAAENLMEDVDDTIMNRAMRIRPVSGQDDRMAVSRVYEESWKEAYRNIVPQAYLDSIPAGAWCEAAFRPDMHSLVMTVGDEIVGTASYYKRRLFDILPGESDFSEAEDREGVEGERRNIKTPGGLERPKNTERPKDMERPKSMESLEDVKVAENCGEIVSIYFLPQYIGKGFGTLLMQAVLAELKKMGYQSCCLWVLEENERASYFYEKMGFVPEGAYMEQEIGGKNLREMRYVLGLG